MGALLLLLFVCVFCLLACFSWVIGVGASYNLYCGSEEGNENYTFNQAGDSVLHYFSSG